MSKPTVFEHDGRQYTFKRHGDHYIITRDDGLTAWDVYPTQWFDFDICDIRRGYHAYRPAFVTIAECQQAIRGERPSTYYHRLIFAASAYQAAKIAEEKDRNA